MPFILGANSVSGYTVKNSLRFNSGSSDYLNRTPASAGNRQKFTYSFWVKRAKLSTSQYFLAIDTGATANFFYFNSSDRLVLYCYSSSGGVTDFYLEPNQLFRDVSAWYHIMLAVDTTSATADNRGRLYVNGSEVTSMLYRTNPTQNFNCLINNTNQHNIGGTSYLDGYLSECYLIDGQQLTPSSFGETDEDSGIWKPKAYTGTYGTNGFYLDFEDSANLGNDMSGNNNDFTVNNLTSIDQTTDTPTNNFCTLNRLMVTTVGGTFATISEGATKWTSTNNETSQNATGSTIGIDKGKWYWEVKWEGSYDTVFGIVKSDINMNASATGGLQTVAGFYGINTNQSATGGSGMRFVDNGTPTGSNGSSVSSGDIIMFALDCDNSRLYIGRNGTWENSGVPASGTGYVMSPASSTTYIPAIANFGYSFTNNGTFNFGNPIYSANSYTDANGYGNFSYSVPSGYYSLCTKNLYQYGF